MIVKKKIVISILCIATASQLLYIVKLSLILFVRDTLYGETVHTTMDPLYFSDMIFEFTEAIIFLECFLCKWAMMKTTFFVHFRIS
jgi:hypothetical protein